MTTSLFAGIHLWSGSSINISQNTVMVSSSDAPSFGPYYGLQTGTVRGLIGCNDLTVDEVPSGAFYSCLNVFSDASSLMTCNNLDGGSVGLRIFGSNANTALKGNIFNTHNVGLQVAGTLGQQIHHGNRWEAPAPQGGWQAQHLSSDPDVIAQSQFVVDGFEDSALLPTQINEAFWFSVQATPQGTTFTCEVNNTCPNGIGAMRHLWELGPSDHAIAADTIAFDRYKEEQAWQAARHLYGRIMDFSIPVPPYSALDTFVQNAQSSSIADFYEAEQKIRMAIVPDGVLDSVVLAREEAKMADMEQLYVLDSLAHSKSGMDSIGYLLAKLDLLDDIRGQKALLDSLHEEIGTLRDTATAEAQQWVDGIVAAEPYEQDLKTVMGLFLHYTVEGKAYSAAQEETLYDIAAQCPLKGSDAIFLARSLYASLDPDAIYDDEALCTAAPELRGLPSSTTVPMEVFPNPARGRAVVNSGWAAAESARLTVYNSLGVPVLQTELPLFGGQGEVDLSQLPNGWYSLLLQAEGERKVARLVIAR